MANMGIKFLWSENEGIVVVPHFLIAFTERCFW